MRKKNRRIQLGSGGYLSYPEGWIGDLGDDKNEQLVRLGRAVWITETKELRPRRKTTYETK